MSTLYPAAGVNELADQLKIVAQLIAGGLSTQVYMVSLNGFDTHAGQVVSGASDTGVHATLLQKMSDAVHAFQDDIKKLGVSDRVLGMTFSEFGRRIIANASLGTDHGAAAPLFIFGESVSGGIIGNNPTIPNNPTVDDNIPMQYDFRSVYSTVLKNWFGVTDEELESTMLNDFPLLNFVNPTGLTNAIHGINAQSVTCYPNPCMDFTHIQFATKGGLIRVRLFDQTGKQLHILSEANYSAGTHEIQINTQHLTAGLYYYQIQMADEQVMKTFVKL
jgi:hypothetical protein